MVERQEIDALLVGALYGELTAADEARLLAHLESHPGDRSALDGLKSTREAVRASRIFQLQINPPQAVSALLLQEAARRAPKLVVHAEHDEAKRESWFARFVRSFVAHPAMATAAMFVVVVGVAGTIYLKQGSEQVADQHAVAVASAPAVNAAPTPATSTTAPLAMAGSGANYQVALAESEPAQPPIAQPAVPKPTAAPVAHRDEGRGEPAQHSYMELHRPQRMPREMPDLPAANDAVADLEPQKEEKEKTRSVPVVTPSAPSVAMGGNVRGAAAGAAPAPPPAPAMTVAKGQQDKNDEDGWAPSQHQRLIELVASGKCQDAAPIAVAIRNRAPDYYNANVATDRKLKSCMQYITDAAEKDAERASKARAAKRAETK